MTALRRKSRKQFMHMLPPVAPPAGPEEATVKHRMVMAPRPDRLRRRWAKARRARLATQGAVTATGYFPRTAADTVAGGASAWTNPTNATLVDDNTLATNAASGGKILDAIDLTNIDWGADATNIANAQQILGIQVEPKWSYTSAGSINATTVQLLLSGLVVGSNKGTGATAWGSNGASTAYGTVFGGATDVWGTTLTGAQLTSSSFGIRLQGTETDGGGGTQTIGKVGKGTALDTNTITVNWTGGGNSTAGSTLLAFLSSNQNNSTITPTTPTNWTLRTSVVTAQGTVHIYEWVNASAISGLTISYSTGGSVPVTLDIMEWTGTGSYDSASTFKLFTNTTTPTTNNITTVSAKTALVAFFHSRSGGSVLTLNTPGTGYTQVQSNNQADDGTTHNVAYATYKVVTSVQTAVSTQCTASGTSTGDSILIAYAAGAAGATAQLDAVKVTITYLPGASGANIVQTTKHRFAKATRLKIRGKWSATKRRLAPYIVGSVAPANPVIQTLRHRVVNAPRRTPLLRGKIFHSRRTRQSPVTDLQVSISPTFERIRQERARKERQPRTGHIHRAHLPAAVLPPVRIFQHRSYAAAMRFPPPGSRRAHPRHGRRIPAVVGGSPSILFNEPGMLTGGLGWE